MLRLPVIDFSKQELEIERESLRDQVRRALEEFGAFEALFDKIPGGELRPAIFGAFEEIFNLSLETKQRNVCKKTLGYVGHNPIIPLYESVAIEEANTIEKVDQGFTNLLWPEGKQPLSETIQFFTEQVAKLDETIRRITLESYGLEKYIDEHLASTTYTLRGFRYKSPQNTESMVGIPPHTDSTVLSILCQVNEVDGLGILTKDGDWIDVKLSPNSFIVLIGESFHAWLNGRLPAPYHRVIMSGNKERFSVGLFSISNEDYSIKAPKELVDAEHPLLYKPFEYAKYIEFSNQYRSKRGAMPTLKDFCGN